MLYWSAFQRVALAAMLTAMLWGFAVLVVQMPDSAPSHDLHETHGHDHEDTHEHDHEEDHGHDHNH